MKLQPQLSAQRQPSAAVPELDRSTMHHSIGSGVCIIFVVVLLLAMTGCQSPRSDYTIRDALDRDDYTWVEKSFAVRGTSYRLALPAPVTDFVPDWNPRSGKDPALLPAKAVSLTRSALDEKFTDAAKWSLDSVEMREIPAIDPMSGLPVGTGKWYYEVCFRPPGEGIHARSPDLDASYPVAVYRMFVLLNGVVIQPKITNKVEQGAAGNSRPRRQLSDL